MFDLRKTTTALRASLLAGVAILISSGAFAAPTPAQCNGPNPPADCAVETVVVTGSLIERNVGDRPTPTVIVGAEDIKKTGYSNVADVLAQLPQVSSNQQVGGDLTSTNSNFLTSGFGVNNVDLRLLGASETLVLVNGKRQVTGSPTVSAVDLNTIPTQLIDRIEVVTGGASAIYGSDAVAGVVNFILKKDFQGVTFTVQGGLNPDHNDASDYFGYATVGGNFADDKGNVTVSVQYDNSGSIHSSNRSYAANDELQSPGTFLIVGPGAFSSFGVAGRFQATVLNPATGLPVGVGGTFNPNGSPFVKSVNGFNRSPHRYIRVPVDRQLIAETGHYDITKDVTVLLDATYAHTHSSQNLEPFPGSSTDGISKPSTAGGLPIIIPRNNPFIPAGLSAAIGPSPSGIFFARRFIDLGDRTGVVDRNMAKITLGLDANLPFWDWKMSSYFEWGRTDESQFNHGFYDKVRLQEALNSRAPHAGEVAPAGGGGFVCNDPIAQAAGCVPINLFGAGSITPQAAKYITALITLQDQATEKVGHIQATGSVFDLPAGAAKLAVGFEWRDESANFVPDAGTQAGTVAGNQVPATSGSFDVTEFFAEGNIPILKDMPFAKTLEVDGAVRRAHYSTAGTAIAWEYNGQWEPFDDLKLRASQSSATRAPNIAELFAPGAQTFLGIGTHEDPCIGGGAAGVVATNCAIALGQLAGTALPGEPGTPSYGGATGQAAAQGVFGITSGNPNLHPETSYSWTAGAVYTPGWLPGFQLVADWYDIRLHGSIASLSFQSTLNACYGANNGGTLAGFQANVFCQQIVRTNNQQLGPVITEIDQPTFNLGATRTSGVDYQATYTFDLGDLDPSLSNDGSLSFNLNGRWLATWEQEPGVIGTTPSDFAGSVGYQRWKALLRTTYANGKWTFQEAAHYVGPTLADKGFGADLIGNRLTSYWTFDTYGSYDLSDQIQLYAGVNNMFDKQPLIIFPGVGEQFSITGSNTDPGSYDVIGRFIYLGATVKLQ